METVQGYRHTGYQRATDQYPSCGIRTNSTKE